MKSEALLRINKILKRKTPQLDTEELFRKIDEREIISVFQKIDQILNNAKELGMEHLAESIASLHHSLFESAIFNNSEKARLSLLYLKTKLFRSVSFSTKELSYFLYNYSKMWFRLLITLEAQAHIYISWLDYYERLRTKINYSDVIQNIHKYLPNVEMNLENMFYEQISTRLNHILFEKPSVEGGEELQRWVYNLMYSHLMEQDKNAFRELICLLYQIPPLDEVLGFEEIFHEYGKSWYRQSLKLKKWFLHFNQKITTDVQLVERLWRGQFWYRISGKPFKLVVEEWRKNHLHFLNAQ